MNKKLRFLIAFLIAFSWFGVSFAAQGIVPYEPVGKSAYVQSTINANNIALGRQLIIANKTGLPGGVNATPIVTGTYSATYRTHLYTSGAVNPGWQFTLECAYISLSSASLPCPNNVTVHASWFSPQIGNTVFPIPFNGNTNGSLLTPGSTLVSDPIAIPIPTGVNDIFVCINYAGISWVGGRQPDNQNGTAGEGASIGLSTADLSPNCSGRTNMTGAYGLVTPTAIIGVPVNPKQSAGVLIGDSRLAGSASNAQGRNDGYAGYAELGWGTLIPWTTSTRASDRLSYYLNSPFRMSAFTGNKSPYVKIAEFEEGINDITAGTSFASMQNMYLAAWNQLVVAGIDVCQDTLYPNVNSSDYFATPGNQTIPDTNKELVRTQLNTWFRTIPKPLTCVNDVDAAIEVNSSGVPTLGGGRYTTVGVISTTGNTHTNTTIDGLAVDPTNWVIGNGICGPNIAPYTYIVAINSTSSITVNQATSGTATGTGIIYNCPSYDGLHAFQNLVGIMANVITNNINNGVIH